eukprot:129837_1
MLSGDVELALAAVKGVTGATGVGVVVTPDVGAMVPGGVVVRLLPLLVHELTPGGVVGGDAVGEVVLDDADDASGEADEDAEELQAPVGGDLHTVAEELLGAGHATGEVDGVLELLGVLEVGHGLGGVVGGLLSVEGGLETEVTEAGETSLELSHGGGGSPD